MKIKEPIKTLARRIFKIMLLLMPDHIKRMIFVVTISRLMRYDQPMTDQAIHHLNSIMRLSQREDAMRFSDYLTKAVWQGRSINQICKDDVCNIDLSSDNERLERIMINITSTMPKELRYGRKEDIFQDMKAVLRERDTLLSM